MGWRRSEMGDNFRMAVWDRSHHGSWHLFGHSHGHVTTVGRSLDVGVDAWDFHPVSLIEVTTALDKK